MEEHDDLVQTVITPEGTPEGVAEAAAPRGPLQLVVIGKLREGPTAQMLDDLNLLDRVSFIHDLSKRISFFTQPNGL